MPLSGRPEARRKQLQNLRPNPQNLRQAPPAPLDNARARKHGAYARVAHARLEAKQREVFDALAEDAPLRDPDGGLPAADSVTVALLAQALCRLEDVGAFLRDHGLLDGDGQIRPAVDLERRLRLEAADHAAAMGMNPAARAKLGLDLVRQHDLALEMQADFEREQAAQRHGPPIDGEGSYGLADGGPSDRAAGRPAVGVEDEHEREPREANGA